MILSQQTFIVLVSALTFPEGNCVKSGRFHCLGSAPQESAGGAGCQRGVYPLASFQLPAFCLVFLGMSSTGLALSGSDREGRSVLEEKREREKHCAVERQHYTVRLKEHLGFPP